MIILNQESSLADGLDIDLVSEPHADVFLGDLVDFYDRGLRYSTDRVSRPVRNFMGFQPVVTHAV